MFKPLPKHIQDALIMLAEYSTDYYATILTKENDEYEIKSGKAYKITFILEKEIRNSQK